MALEDAVVLARCINEFKGEDWSHIFQRFENIRKPRTSEIQLASSANQWMQKATNPDWVYGYNAWDIALQP
jgi:salicylate hydroxylase/6-hydroxynicotinate 3-monooxygenase